jgi:plastocyanin
MLLSFTLRTTFGWLPLKNLSTDESGKAAVDYTPTDPGTYLVRVVFEGNATYAAANATVSFVVSPAAPLQPSGLQPDTIIVLLILAVVGGVWATYGFVAWQIGGIRSDRSEEEREESTTEVKTTMEKEEETPKRVSGSANTANRTGLVLAVVALVLGALALSVVGIQALTNAPAAPTYTPGTVDLQIAVVPDLQGSGWDVWLPNLLTVHVGDTVHLTILNSDEMEHGFKLDTFGIDKPLPAATSDAGGNTTPSQTIVTFTPDQVGSFEFKCNVPCGPGHDFMVGTLVVLPD